MDVSVGLSLEVSDTGSSSQRRISLVGLLIVYIQVCQTVQNIPTTSKMTSSSD